MNFCPAIVESYSYADMFVETSHDNSRPTKMKAGGLSANYILNEQSGGGGPLENKVVPIGLVLDRKRAKREVEFDNDDDDDENYKIDVLSDFIFDDFIRAVSKYSVAKSRRRLTARNKKLSKST